MTKLHISKLLDTKEGRIALANAMTPEIHRYLEEKVFGFIPPKTKKEKITEKALNSKLRDIIDSQVNASAEVHKTVTERPWDFVQPLTP